jgi:excisionase family DNA binding protein
MRLVTPAEAAHVLSTSRQTIWTWAKDGKIPFLQNGEGGRMMIDLASFLKRGGIDPAPYFATLDALKIKDDDDNEE